MRTPRIWRVAVVAVALAAAAPPARAQRPAPADVFDGHSIAFVGYKVSDNFPGGGYLVFRNSWGNGFMEDGYGYMSFDYANKYTNDAVEYVLP